MKWLMAVDVVCVVAVIVEGAMAPVLLGVLVAAHVTAWWWLGRG